MCLELLGKGLVPCLNTAFEKGEITLQQNGAISHTANFVQKWCKRSMAEWPPFSPDLNPMDFAIESILESKTCPSGHRGISTLGHGLGTCLDRISGETMCVSCSQVPGGLRCIVGVGRGCIKK